MSPGDVLGGRFSLIGELGRGGMATVWLAEDRTRGERVALKVLHAHLADDPEARARLSREVRAASRIRHPSVLVAHELHELDGHLALSMPAHPGVTLEALVADGPLDAASLTRLARQLSGALAEAHRQGVIHRDITPNNVLMDARGDAALVDFGLSRLEDGATATATSVAGTWGYAAPEIYEGARADPRGDLYSLGAVLWFAATGAPPYDAPTPGAVLRLQLEGALPSLAERRPDLSVSMVQTIEALLQRRPEDRPEAAATVRDALDAGRLLPAPLPTLTAGGAGTEPGMAPGMYTLIISDHREDRARRKALRKGAGAIGPGEDAEPERLLAAAVAARRGLAPPESLPEEMRRVEYKLVEAVTHEDAERLASEALRLGLVPRIAADPHVKWSKNENLKLVLGIVGMALALVMCLIGVAKVPLVLIPAAITALVCALLISTGFDEIQMLTAFPRKPLGLTAAPAPAALPAPDDPVGRARLRTERQLEALERSLGGADERSALPDQAVAELKRTLGALRERAADLAARASALREENQRALDAGAAARRVRARLRRLETARAAGEPVDDAEVARLEAALEAHREQLLARDSAEALETLLSARLMEIGAAADRAARTLRGDEAAATSAADLLNDLVRETDEARAAAAELSKVALTTR